jgi:hypothetical protein
MALNWIEYDNLTAWEIFDNALDRDTPEEMLFVMDEMINELRRGFEDTEFFQDNKEFIEALDEFETRLLAVTKLSSAATRSGSTLPLRAGRQ